MKYTTLRKKSGMLAHKAVALMLSLIFICYSAPKLLKAGAEALENVELPKSEREIKSDFNYIGGVNANETHIIEELKSERSETAKRYLMSDGTVLTEDYGYPIHYKTGKSWKEIDNRLVAETNMLTAETYYRNAKNSFEVNFSEKFNGLNDSLVLKKGEHTLSIELENTIRLPEQSITGQIENGVIKTIFPVQIKTDFKA